MALDMEHLNKEFEELHADYYIGDRAGNPSMKVRVAILEETVQTISSNLGKMVWILVGIFITIVGDVIIHGAHLQ